MTPAHRKLMLLQRISARACAARTEIIQLLTEMGELTASEAVNCGRSFFHIAKEQLDRALPRVEAALEDPTLPHDTNTLCHDDID